jgi:D-arabinose 1-dehydrogenase-like Zn-dependent alcohol dehydrogenase
MHSDLIALCLSWSGRWLKLALPALPLTGCRESTALGNGVDGGNRELMAVPAVNVIPIPDNLDFNQAASVSSRVFDSLAQRVVGPDHVITFGGNNNSG